MIEIFFIIMVADSIKSKSERITVAFCAFPSHMALNSSLRSTVATFA